MSGGTIPDRPRPRGGVGAALSKPWRLFRASFIDILGSGPFTREASE